MTGLPVADLSDHEFGIEEISDTMLDMEFKAAVKESVFEDCISSSIYVSHNTSPQTSVCPETRNTCIHGRAQNWQATHGSSEYDLWS